MFSVQEKDLESISLLAFFSSQEFVFHIVPCFFGLNYFNLVGFALRNNEQRQRFSLVVSLQQLMAGEMTHAVTFP